MSHPARVLNFHSVCLWPQASCLFTWETLRFQQIVKHLFTEGDLTRSPELPLRFAIVVHYLSGGIAPGACLGGGGITFRSLKIVKKIILSISGLQLS